MILQRLIVKVSIDTIYIFITKTSHKRSHDDVVKEMKTIKSDNKISIEFYCDFLLKSNVFYLILHIYEWFPWRPVLLILTRSCRESKLLKAVRCAIKLKIQRLNIVITIQKSVLTGSTKLKTFKSANRPPWTMLIWRIINRRILNLFLQKST